MTAPVPPWPSTSAKIWRALSADERHLAAAEVVKDPSDLVRATAVAVIAQARNMRAQTARRLDRDAQARILASVRDPGEVLAASLLVALHLGHRRPLLTRFLDAAGLPHENGVLAEDAPSELSAEAFDRAIASLSDTPRREAQVYLNTLLIQDPDRWGRIAGLDSGQIGSSAAEPAAPSASGSASQ
jgi:hypothetical protein